MSGAGGPPATPPPVAPPPATVAVLGLGEAGGRVAADLVAAGARVRGFDPAAAAPAGVEAAGSDAAACRGAGLVISLVTAAESEEALRQALPGLEPGACYADANTASARQKERLAGLAGAAGVAFADVAIMAPILAGGLGTPMLASGPAAAAVAGMLRGWGARVEVLDGPAGAAATRKLLRSVFYKGMAAAVVEALRAAEAAGQADWLRGHIAAELAAADEAMAARLEQGSYQHAARRVHEMAAAAELVEELGVPPRVTRAAAGLLGELSRLRNP